MERRPDTQSLRGVAWVNLRVMTVVGTRPEIIRLSRVIAALDRSRRSTSWFTPGQNYDYALNQVFFEDLEIRTPDHYLKAAGRPRRRPSVM